MDTVHEHVPLNPELREKIVGFLKGDLTWAQVEGITAEKAQHMAQLACDLASAGRLDDARKMFEGLVAINPFDAAALAALGTVYQKLDEPLKALDAYDNCLKLDSKNAVALANRGELRLKREDAEGLRDLYAAVEADSQLETFAAQRAMAIIQAMTLRADELTKEVNQQKT